MTRVKGGNEVNKMKMVDDGAIGQEVKKEKKRENG